MRTRTRIWLAAATTAIAGSIPAVALAVVPVPTPLPPVTQVTINTSAGDQYDPHVSGDWSVYTSDLTIRYFNFATGVDAQIPQGTSVRDLLAGVSGSRIVFSRVTTLGTSVMLFDAATPSVAPVEIDPTVGGHRIYAAIGGQTVAYVDYHDTYTGELVVHDLASNTSVRLTNDTAYDQNASVSADGKAVVWEHCLTSSSNCDIWQAVKSGAGWTVSIGQDSVYSELDPSTNGDVVLYSSLRLATENQLLWRTLAGGPEQHLEVPGFLDQPTVVGSLVAYQGRPDLFGTADIYVYDMATNRQYRLTDTPLVHEHLEDISVGTDGTVHVVWASDEDGFDSRNVRGATFRLPSASAQISALIDKTLTYLNLPTLRATLKARLDGAFDAVVAGNKPAACSALQIYITAVRVLPLTPAQRADLIGDANSIRALIGC
jgi:hypothetical protein